jgi:hypothetical protein
MKVVHYRYLVANYFVDHDMAMALASALNRDELILRSRWHNFTGRVSQRELRRLSLKKRDISIGMIDTVVIGVPEPDLVKRSRRVIGEL